jgi:hypothetical protein
MMHDNTGMVDAGKTSMKTGNPVKKPKPVLDYNKDMRDVCDRMDQQFASYPIMCPHLKACKIFFYLT